MKRILYILSIITSVLSLSSIARAQTITAGGVTGKISACVGTTSAAPLIQQFTISGSGLSADITATAPTGFEVSLAAGSGYGSSVTLAQTGGLVNNAIVYVRSLASATAGNITGNVTLTSPGATSQNVAVTGTVNALSTVNPVSNQTLTNGATTSAVNFTGTGNYFKWTNDTPGIGLPASGTGDIASFAAVNTGSTPVVATIAVTTVMSGLAYIPNEISNNVSVINTTTNTVQATIPVGNYPFGVAVSNDGSRVYITHPTQNMVSVINTSTNAVISTIGVGTAPAGIAISPDGSKLYVANAGSGSMSVISTASNRVISTISLNSNPTGVSVSPDGSRVYLTNTIFSNYVSVFNTLTNTVIAMIPVDGQAQFSAVSPDGKFVYVTVSNPASILVINTATNLIAATINLNNAAAPYAYPYGICVSPDGKWVYVSNLNDGGVSVINTATNLVTNTIADGMDPKGLSTSPDGNYLYVANSGANTVSIINTATNTVISTVDVGTIPASLGNFVTAGTECSGAPTTFTITVNPTVPDVIVAGATIGSISACAGTASTSPYIEQFTVSCSILTGNITATAPTGFEVSLSAAAGYGSSVMLTPMGGTLNSTVIYVRSAASAPAGNISGSVTLTLPGATSQNVAVTGTVSALPTVNPVSNQTVTNGATTSAVNFTGTGNYFKWTNDTPGIGLPASGTGDIASFAAINTGSTPLVATITATPLFAGFAYICDDGSGTVSVISTLTDMVVAKIPVGSAPNDAAVSPDGSRVYVSDSGAPIVSVINTATNTVIATVPIGGTASALAVTPDGSRVYAGNSVINTATNTVVANIPTGSTPVSTVISPDGKFVYESCTDLNVVVISTATNSIVATWETDAVPYGAAVTPDGSTLYLANYLGRDVWVINIVGNNGAPSIPVDLLPTGVTVSPDGKFVYVTIENTASVDVISTESNSVVATIPVGYLPFGISITADGSKLYVVNSGSKTVSVINTATNKVISTITVGASPDTLQFIGNFITRGRCDGIPVKFTITVNPGSFPTITATGNPSPLTTIYGTPSTSTTFTVSGTNLTAGILVTAPAGFEVSTDGVNYSGMVTVNGSGTIAPTTVYIRLTSSKPVGSTPVGDNYSGNIVLTSAGAANANVEMPVSTVTPAPLTITADDKSKALGEANPVLTVTYSGFVNNDGPAQLTTQPVITTTALTTSPAGQYPITAAGAADPNYTITYVPGILTINPQPQTITVPNAFTPNGDGVNDTWDIKYLNTFPNCTVAVFNRWGQNVYSSNGYGTPWDGSYKGNLLPTGTYYYMINLRNGLSVLSGYVAIIR